MTLKQLEEIKKIGIPSEELFHEVCDELLKYKQFEEQQIGCPIEVRCEILPDSYIYTFGTSMDTIDVITGRKVTAISREGIHISYATASGRERDMTLPWRAYKKTWWLKSDRSE